MGAMGAKGAHHQWRAPRSSDPATLQGNDRRRRFGAYLRDVTGRMARVGRMTGQRRGQRRNGRMWDDITDDDFREHWGDNWGDAPGLAPPDLPVGFGMSTSGRAGRGAGKAGASGKSGRGHGVRKLSTRLVVALALLSVILGFCCTQSTLTLLDAFAAARDAQAQVSIIQDTLKSGNYLDTDHLTELQTHLVTLNNDLDRLNSDLPWAAHAPIGSSVAHMIAMATKMTQAGRYGVDAALILLPHLKGMFSDIGASASEPPGAAKATATATATPTPASTGNTATGGLTMDEVQRAQQDIVTASALAQAALVERRQIDDAQLGSVGLGKFVTLLHKLDAIAPQLPTYLGYAHTVMNALPDLLGLTKPAHYLLFDMDSDELRPSGGFLGNYAVLTVQQGHLIGGVHLKDVITLDCPSGSCPYNPIPAFYSWMNIDPSYFGMRDSNLSPDYPTSAQMVLQQYQRESGQKVDGVVMITPEIIKDILTVTGPIKVDGFDQTVDAKNLQDVIHYYHILSHDFGVNPGNSGTTQRKVIDTLLGGLLLKKFGALDAGKQNTVLKQIIQGFGTKDVQFYLTNPKVQAVLAGMKIDAAIPMPSPADGADGFDGLMATDANVGATYYNSDMQETVNDTITFDSQGNATHDATITYKFQMINHLYTPVLLKGNVTWYNDVARIVVPEAAKLLSWGATQCPTSCFQVQAPEKGHQVWAVRIQDLQRGQTVILHFKWTTPKALQTVNGAQRYQLQLYRQAGNRVGYTITIKPPAKSTIAQPLPAPFKTPAKTEAGTAAQFTIPVLLKDTRLALSFTGS